MDYRKNNQADPWEDGVYGTGDTTPPKSYGGLVTALIIIIIFLSGVTSILGFMNIRMFQQLQSEPEDSSAPISFYNTGESGDTTLSTQASTEAVPEDSQGRSDMTLDLQQTPESVDNVHTEGGLSLQAIYEKNIPSVVSISCSGESGTSTGTGVVLSADGYVVTNCHVVDKAREIRIQLTDNRVFSATLVGADAVSDLAVLYVEADDLIPAEFGDSAALRVGDAVTAIGDPLGVTLRGTYTDGIISAINRDVTTGGRTLTLIQTNAALNSGNSGGPLINCYGQVIGINTMKIGAFMDSAGVEGLGFAIPSTTVKEIVDQLIEQGYVSGRPTLGITGESVSSFLQRRYRLPAGLFITEVTPGGPADEAYIEYGDILISVDGTRITDMENLNSVLYAYSTGDTVELIIYRSGLQYTLDLTLGEAGTLGTESE